MATYLHPVTGVELNQIDVRRKSLDETEQATVRLLRQSGTYVSDIAHMMGTNPARIGEVLRGDVCPKAAHAVRDLLR